MTALVFLAVTPGILEPARANDFCYVHDHDFKADYYSSSRYKSGDGTWAYWHLNFRYQGTHGYWPWDYWWTDFYRTANVFNNRADYDTNVPSPKYWHSEEGWPDYSEEVEIGTMSPWNLVRGQLYYSRAYFSIVNHGSYTIQFEAEYGPYGEAWNYCYMRFIQDQV